MRRTLSGARATAPWPGGPSPASRATASALRPSARTAAATPSSASARRLQTATCAPTLAISTAMARPMPWLAPVTRATRSRSVSGEKPIASLLDDRVRRRDDAGDLDLLAVDQSRDLGRDLVLPVVALVHGVVESLALAFVLEAADPHVHALVFLADEAAEDDHAHLDLKGDDLLLHALHPRLLLSRTDVILPQLEEHASLLGVGRRPGRPARKEYTVHDPLPMTTCGCCHPPVSHPVRLASHRPLRSTARPRPVIEATHQTQAAP